MPHFELAGLRLLRIERVWPVAETFVSVDNIPEDYYGSGVLILGKK
jgi:hypothetical protein